MDHVLVREYFLEEDNQDGSMSDCSFIKVLKTKHFKMTDNCDHNIQEMRINHPSVEFDEEIITIRSNELDEDIGDIEQGDEMRVIEEEEKLKQSRDRDEDSVVIEDGSYSHLGRGFVPNECNLFGTNFPYSSCYPRGELELPFKDEKGNCTKSLIKNLNLVLMLVSLIVPIFLHVFCEFRLYNHLLEITSRIKREGVKNGGEVRNGVLSHLAEFENFFFLGVVMYVAIQFMGFAITHSRYEIYLKHLCLMAIENARGTLLNKHRKEALDKLAKYCRRASVDSGVFRKTKRNLMKAFNEGSYLLNESRISQVWEKIQVHRIKIFLVKIWMPFALNVCLSGLICLFIYYKRFKMNYKVPLGHPKIVSNMHWYVAVQYEGFLWILQAFLVNLATWLFLCLINRHDHFFKSMDDSLVAIKGVLEDFVRQISRNIWDREMFFIMRNTYSGEIESTDSLGEYQRYPSEIKLNKEEDYRPCPCKYLCTGTDEVNIYESKADELSVELLSGKVKRYKRF